MFLESWEIIEKKNRQNSRNTQPGGQYSWAANACLSVTTMTWSWCTWTRSGCCNVRAVHQHRSATADFTSYFSKYHPVDMNNIILYHFNSFYIYTTRITGICVNEVCATSGVRFKCTVSHNPTCKLSKSISLEFKASMKRQDLMLGTPRVLKSPCHISRWSSYVVQQRTTGSSGFSFRCGTSLYCGVFHCTRMVQATDIHRPEVLQILRIAETVC